MALDIQSNTGQKTEKNIQRNPRKRNKLMRKNKREKKNVIQKIKTNNNKKKIPVFVHSFCLFYTFRCRSGVGDTITKLFESFLGEFEKKNC